MPGLDNWTLCVKSLAKKKIVFHIFKMQKTDAEKINLSEFI